MMARWWMAVAGLAWSSGALAADPKLIDLTKPDVVADAVKAAGYKAELTTNSKGEPVIRSATNGQNFTVEFYGCKSAATDCGSFQFYSYYKKDPLYTLELVNEWNASKRFLKIAIDRDGDLSEYMDFTSIGLATPAAFADMLDWYTVMDASLGKFLAEKRAAAKGS